ncbi:hypothetical protein A3D14_03665 [Candidatus Saccharibacteria bacterium RIFCSPHIGHO2_02_FULL_47_12]|nr:MAG: hypothetical protein A3D14_03665 [Candidatus Saccharibacteria bacterium RIFCSPHIGHO2_02_FULL_47_12]
MEPNNNKRLRIFAAVFVLIMVGLAVFVFINNLGFHITKTVPKLTGTTPSILNGFKIEFNRELASNVDYMKTLNDEAKHVKSIRLNGKSMLVVTQLNEEGKKYKFNINNIKAKDGSVIKSVRFDYIARFKPAEKLSDDERALFEELGSLYKADNPILAHLPYSNLDFRLSGQFEQSESGELGAFYLDAKLYLSNADIKIGRDDAIAQRKKAINDYIASLGFDPGDFTIKYEIIEPSG